jgi:hypothetical protein
MRGRPGSAPVCGEKISTSGTFPFQSRLRYLANAIVDQRESTWNSNHESAGPDGALRLRFAAWLSAASAA